jgi:hypothetical protein
MSIEKIRTTVISHIWQAIAQSGVDLSTIPQDDQDKLVRKISDSVLLTFDSILEAELKPDSIQDDLSDDLDETIIWSGRPFLSMVESYIITSERVKVIKGLVSREIENFELIRIQDIDFKQNVGERIIGLGDLVIRGHDASDPIITLRNVTKPEEVYELLRRAWLEARKRYGLQFREYM